MCIELLLTYLLTYLLPADFEKKSILFSECDAGCSHLLFVMTASLRHIYVIPTLNTNALTYLLTYLLSPVVHWNIGSINMSLLQLTIVRFPLSS